ncbi:hypothetical protein SISSUDRAFT_1055379 [Sistotremastrum suecicum HHB10207 ss-3]|uniref:Uncharacterized protein n=1 Tax=Sistotremastrum suecicum HHB10207 ss-3 TaxID=1314776 RepID=A0A165XU37_9AGAM|nr:hypothetical protein SISSUDRAFT_1055379 [Sistotremastrum suecicum HHB10207 ss-3]
MTSLADHSPFPFTAEECRSLLDMLRHLHDYEPMLPYRNCAISRLLSEIFAHRVLHFHGDLHARLSRCSSVWPTNPVQKSAWVVAAEYSLMKFPTHHHESLRNLWVDKIAYVRSWNAYLEELTTEWERAIGHSAACVMSASMLKILLGASSLQSNVWVELSQGFSTAAISMALVSLLSGILSLQMRRDAHEGAEVVAFFEKKTHPTLGLYPFAILLSIPFATCVWSLALLAVATASGTFGTVSGDVALISLAPPFIALCLIYISLDYVNEAPGFNVVLRFLGNAAHHGANWLQHV